jgi:phospholipase/carboxylesterase
LKGKQQPNDPASGKEQNHCRQIDAALSSQGKRRLPDIDAQRYFPSHFRLGRRTAQGSSRRRGTGLGGWPPGTYDIRLGANRDGLFYVPPDLPEARPHPLIVMLHGGGDAARDVVPMLQSVADQFGIIVLAPESQASDSWDILEGAYGPDIEFIDHALEVTFGRFTIDADRVAIAGFSDGASYALSVGLMNGDLFRDILAFSPGFAEPAKNIGKPRIFISHGDKDMVLPFESGGRRLAKELGEAGYDVDYREFDGGHTVPADLVAEATKRFLG